MGEILKISQLGIELVNIPASLQDLEYTIRGGSIADFSTTTLTSLDSGCASSNVGAGTLAIYTGKYDKASAPVDNEAFVKQFANFWVGNSHPEAYCSSNADTQSLQTSQMAEFQALAANPSNIQLIN